MVKGIQPALGQTACLLEHARTLLCEYVGQGSKKLCLNRYTVVKGDQVESDESVTRVI